MADDAATPVKDGDAATPIKDVNHSDILLGRGKSIHFHPGNIEYRKKVKEKSREYQVVDSEAKDVIATGVIEEVEKNGGRFLRPSSDGVSWEPCPTSVVRTKVKQALRDMVKERRPTGQADMKSNRRGDDRRPPKKRPYDEVEPEDSKKPAARAMHSLGRGNDLDSADRALPDISSSSFAVAASPTQGSVPMIASVLGQQLQSQAMLPNPLLPQQQFPGLPFPNIPLIQEPMFPPSLSQASMALALNQQLNRQNQNALLQRQLALLLQAQQLTMNAPAPQAPAPAQASDNEQLMEILRRMQDRGGGGQS